MKSLYNRLFYGAFLNGKKSTPFEQSDGSSAGIGVMFFSTMLLVNVFALTIISYKLWEGYLWEIFHNSPWLIILIGGIIFLINVFLYLFRKRYLQVIRQFEDEPNQGKRKTTIIWVTYVFLSIALVFAVFTL